MIEVSKVKDLVKKCLWQKSSEIEKSRRAMEQREGMIVTFEKEKDILLEMVRQLRNEVKELKLTREEKDEEIAQIRIDLEVKLNATTPSHNLVNLKFPKISEVHQKNGNLKRKAADDDDTMTQMLEIQNSKMQKLFSSAADSTAVSDLETIQELIEVSDSDNEETVISGAEDDYSEDEDDQGEGGGLDVKDGGGDLDETKEATGKEEENRGSEKSQLLFDRIEELMVSSTKPLTESKTAKGNSLSDYKQRILEDDSESEEEESGGGEERRVDCEGDAESNGEESDAENQDDGVVISVISDDLFNRMKKEKVSNKSNNYDSEEEDVSAKSEISRCKMELAKVANLQVFKREQVKEGQDSSLPSFDLPLDETNQQATEEPAESEESEEVGETEADQSDKVESLTGSKHEAEKMKEMEPREEYPAELFKEEAVVGKVQCEECNFSTGNKRNLRNHVKRMHSKVEPVGEEATKNSRALVVYDDSVENEPVAKRRKRMGKGCGECEGCRSDDCDQCRHCMDKPRNGGENKLKQKCMARKCLGQ